MRAHVCHRATPHLPCARAIVWWTVRTKPRASPWSHRRPAADVLHSTCMMPVRRPSEHRSPQPPASCTQLSHEGERGLCVEGGCCFKFRPRVSHPPQVPYLVEWALFYRALQGVSRVSICDHGSTDDPHLINDLFQSRGIDGVVIEPAPEVLAVSAPCGLVPAIGFGKHGALPAAYVTAAWHTETWSIYRVDQSPVLAPCEENAKVFSIACMLAVRICTANSAGESARGLTCMRSSDS